MKQELVKSDDNMLAEIQNTQKMYQLLMQAPHYKRMGSEGVYAIIEKAKSVGVQPIDALNGGMYFVQGKVEMTAAMMNQLIRMHKHSVTKDKKSNDQICILHGKRADNGDTWVASFSIEEAKRAGIYRNQWQKYPQDMLFARALSRLARQLFPDIIKGCYVQGEIGYAPPLDTPPEPSGVHNDDCVSSDVQNDNSVSETLTIETQTVDSITSEEFEELDAWLGDNHQLRGNIAMYLKKKYGITDFKLMPREIYKHALTRAKQQHAEAEQAYGEELQVMEA